MPWRLGRIYRNDKPALDTARKRVMSISKVFTPEYYVNQYVAVINASLRNLIH